MGLGENGTYRDACWTLWVKMLSRSGAFRKMPCFHLPLRIWLLRWVCVLFLRESVLYGALVWLLCWDPLDLDKSSTCHWVSLDMSMELTHGVGSVCFAMMPWRTISFSSLSISALFSIGTFRLPCCTGGTLGSVLMSYSPDMSPIWLKELGNRVCKSLVLLMCTLPGST